MKRLVAGVSTDIFVAVQSHKLTVGLNKIDRRFFGNASGANHVGDAFHLLFALLPGPELGTSWKKPPTFFSET